MTTEPEVVYATWYDAARQLLRNTKTRQVDEVLKFFSTEHPHLEPAKRRTMMTDVLLSNLEEMPYPNDELRQAVKDAAPRFVIERMIDDRDDSFGIKIDHKSACMLQPRSRVWR